MSYTPSQRARYVDNIAAQMQLLGRDAFREVESMNGSGDELRASLQLVLDQLADVRTEAKELVDAD